MGHKCPDKEQNKPIILKTKAIDQIKMLIKELPELEWMALLIGKELETVYVIEELIIPEQESQKAHIELTKQGDLESSKINNIGWIHSHNTMEAFFSENDIETASQNDISIVTNNKLKMKAIITKTLPCGRQALVETKVKEEERKDNNFIRTIKEKIKERRVEITPLKETTLYKFGGEYANKWKERSKGNWQPDCQYCFEQIKPHEESVIESGLHFHKKCIHDMEAIEEELGTIKEMYHNR